MEKRQYMKQTAEGAFRPYAVEAEIYDYGDKLRFRVLLPEPHKLPLAEDWSTKMDLGAFQGLLKRLRREIEKMGLPLENWEAPPFTPL